MGQSTRTTTLRDKRRTELKYLDGIRGGAAIAVVLYHSYLFTGLQGQAETELPIVAAVFGWGYLGVPVFIVLSGYLLMPERGLAVPNGIRTFLWRRSKRILPPYYAALAISLMLIAIFPVLQTPSGTQWDGKIPVSITNTLAHVFMVHDFSAEWIEKINGPLWSVALEWQIYFVMPLVLLPLWRRLNPALIVTVLTVVTTIPLFLGVGTFLHPWLLALFAAGMWSRQLVSLSRPTRTVGCVFLICLVLIPIGYLAASPLGVSAQKLSEVPAGFAIAAGLVWIGRRHSSGATPAIARLLQTRPLMTVGLFSYSLYLLHSPLVALGNLLLLPIGMPIWAQSIVMTFVVVPLVVASCYGFFWLVERHFLNTRQRHVSTELAAAPSTT
jgi:peptidoglycan/LPS O-acetylase OafA/YrhL